MFKWNPVVWIGRYLSNEFPIQNSLKHGDGLLALLFNFALQYAIWKVQANQVEMKWNRTHQLLVCVDDVNLLGKDIQTTQKNTDTWVASMDIGLDVAEKTKYYSCLMKRQQEKITM